MCVTDFFLDCAPCNKVFIYLTFKLFCGNVCLPQCMWGQRTTFRSWFSSPPESQTQIIRHSCKHFSHWVILLVLPRAWCWTCSSSIQVDWPVTKLQGLMSLMPSDWHICICLYNWIFIWVLGIQTLIFCLYRKHFTYWHTHTNTHTMHLCSRLEITQDVRTPFAHS